MPTVDLGDRSVPDEGDGDEGVEEEQLVFLGFVPYAEDDPRGNVCASSAGDCVSGLE